MKATKSKAKVRKPPVKPRQALSDKDLEKVTGGARSDLLNSTGFGGQASGIILPKKRD